MKPVLWWLVKHVGAPIMCAFGVHVFEPYVGNLIKRCLFCNKYHYWFEGPE